MQLRPVRLRDEGDLAETGLACRCHEVREFLVLCVRVGTQVQFRRRRLQRRGVEACLDGGQVDMLAVPEQHTLAVNGYLDLVGLGWLNGGDRLRQIDLDRVREQRRGDHEGRGRGRRRGGRRGRGGRGRGAGRAAAGGG